MSQTWVEDLDAEYDDADYDDADNDDGEYDESDAEYDDADYDDGEAARRRRRRSRRARAGRGRRRRVALRGGPPTTAAAIRAVGANQKAAEDDLRNEIARLRSDGRRSTWVTVLSALVGQGLTFKAPSNKYLETAIRSAPLLALPTPRGKGAAGLLTSPQAIGVAGMFAVAVLGTEFNKDKVIAPTSIKVKMGSPKVLSARVVSAAGAPVTATFTYTPSDPSIVEVKGNTITGKTEGFATVVATSSSAGEPTANIDVEIEA